MPFSCAVTSKDNKFEKPKNHEICCKYKLVIQGRGKFAKTVRSGEIGRNVFLNRKLIVVFEFIFLDNLIINA